MGPFYIELYLNILLNKQVILFFGPIRAELKCNRLGKIPVSEIQMEFNNQDSANAASLKNEPDPGVETSAHFV